VGVRIVGAFANWASGTAMCRKITRQSRWNLRRVSDKAIPNQAPGMVGEGVETGWRASLVDEGTVRLSSKGESDRITQRSAVQIRPPQPSEYRNAVAFASHHPLPLSESLWLSVEIVRARGWTAGANTDLSGQRRRQRYFVMASMMLCGAMVGMILVSL